ncbi:hypothetical protein TSUD_318770 [Trifolium subterraneum]|uniref:Uncharacterized protein n=1 Tax=Trifolium subterraneum TaxID=3900 RepID=A0A2Z6N7P4_TRISU|nr:hypothetical protein TSUD_318770 [Trifolium subterraneum]
MQNGKVVVVKSQSKERLAILELAHMMSVPMSLIAVLNMKAPDAIWHNTPLSASQFSPLFILTALEMMRTSSVFSAYSPLMIFLLST